MLETTRAFLALNLDVASARRVATLLREVRSAPAQPPARLRLVPPANLHIGLRFLGDIDPSIAPAVVDPLRPLLTSIQQWRVLFDPLSAFPSTDRARVLLVGLRDTSGVMETLAKAIENAAREIGLPASEHPFHPHLTLGRLDELVDATQWLANLKVTPLSEGRIAECLLVRQVKKRGGALHEDIIRIPFLAPPSRSQRPSRAPKQPSQRPCRARPDGPAPGDPEPGLRVDGIPGPPRLPSVQPSAGQKPACGDRAERGGCPAQKSPQSQPPAAASHLSRGSSMLPPAVEAALPPDDGWEEP